MKNIGLEKGKGGQAKAIIAPHGAWEISGSLAGAAFASAAARAGKKSPSRAVIMGPIHDIRENGLFLSNSHSFQTPLGDILVDQKTNKKLQSYGDIFEVNDIPHLHEHSIEVLLPFVKYCFPDTPIVPILAGGPREQYAAPLSQSLRAVFEPFMEDTLFIISLNLAVHPDETAALSMAREAQELFREGRRDELNLALQDGRIAGCGGTLLAALLCSGLLDTARASLASETLLSARGENDRMVYYGAFSFG